MRKNVDIRVLVAESGLYYKQIAETLGISPNTLSRELRYELSPKNKQRIRTAINKTLEKESAYEYKRIE